MKTVRRTQAEVDRLPEYKGMVPPDPRVCKRWKSWVEGWVDYWLLGRHVPDGIEWKRIIIVAERNGVTQ